MSFPPPMPPVPYAPGGQDPNVPQFHNDPYNQPVYPPYQQQTNYVSNSSNDDEFASSAFNEKTIRRKFISKVYAILTVQLSVTIAIVSIFLFVPGVSRWVQLNSWFYWMSYGVFLVTYLALVCCKSVRRSFPGNFIALAIFTLAFSYLTGTITSYYTVNSVLVCLCITAGVTALVSLFAIMCPCDITKCQALMMMLSVLLLIFGIICMIVYFVTGQTNPVLHAVYGGVAAFVFTLYLAYDTQLIIGGKKYEMSPEDYVYGALQLYVDVVNIFLALLSIFGARS